MATKRSAKTTPANTATPSDAVDAQLARYRSMRDFSVTAEPAGGHESNTKQGLPFVIQKHAATRLHYDFRLGWNGVLKSWAVAKGPSYNVKDKRLAVEVEDHPMEMAASKASSPKASTAAAPSWCGIRAPGSRRKATRTWTPVCVKGR